MCRQISVTLGLILAGKLPGDGDAPAEALHPAPEPQQHLNGDESVEAEDAREEVAAERSGAVSMMAGVQRALRARPVRKEAS